MGKILVIEDDVMFGRMLGQFLSRNQFEADVANSGAEALEFLSKSAYSLVLSDLRLPDVTDFELLQSILKTYPYPVIMMSNHADIGTAVAAIKYGAADYLTKPLKPEEVLAVIRNHIHTTSKPEPSQPKPTLQQTDDYVSGTSDASKKLTHYVDLVGPTDFSVLIEGESGTGKEVLARRIHSKSLRKDKIFIAVDCGAIPKDLASSEFFGHKKGAFTGAVNDKTGYFEAANGGTLFLDEIGNLSYEHQIQLLRALQERKVRPVGGVDDVSVDIRIIAATNENLRQSIAEGKFREDLFHRLNEFTILSPALRDREEDMVLFATYFLEKVNAQLGKEVYGFSPEVLSVFRKYHWPGNLREMNNIVKKATLLASDNLIRPEDLPLELEALPASGDTATSLKDMEKETILSALRDTNFNRTKTAEKLNINRKTLYNKLKSYGLDGD